MANIERELSPHSIPVDGLTEDCLVARPRSVKPSAYPEVVCPKCNWTCAHRARRRNALDLLSALFLLRPFRCRSCHRRFYRLPFLYQ